MTLKNYFLILSSIFYFPLLARSVSFSSQPIDENTQEIAITINLEPEEWLYKDSISITSDNPHVTISHYKVLKESINRYDPSFKKTKKIFESNVTLLVTAHKNPSFTGEAFLHITTSTNKQGPEEDIFLLPFKDNKVVTTTTDQKEQPVALQSIEKNQLTKPTEPFSVSRYLSALIKNIHSPAIRLILVFLLGVLLSLTPCIYPMIPITIGVLQSQGSKSLLYNFLLALSYTCGMATTFALFGLLASCTGPICGQLLMEPLFIAGLVVLLSYLAFSMLGFYDVYVPKFFRPSKKSAKGGTPISSFIFGAASGTIASPCVSPGLALLLSIVATLGNKFLGFLLLFVFGIGLSTPLLVVGTFSSSLNLLPKAGMWMIEVKKLFGFMIFGMCFYYMSYIMPFSILLWIIALATAVTGMYYLYSSQTVKSLVWKKISLLLAIGLLTSSCILAFQAYRAMTFANKDTYNYEKNPWHTNYEDALNQARVENKKLFIDFWATFCPVCLAINKTVLTKPAILSALQQFVMLKVDGSYSTNKPYEDLKTKYTIKGFPTFLLIDPTTEAIIKQWGGELYDMAQEEVIAAFNTAT